MVDLISNLSSVSVSNLKFSFSWSCFKFVVFVFVISILKFISVPVSSLKLSILEFCLCGEVTERPKVHAWKACVQKCTQGSNPCLSEFRISDLGLRIAE